MNQFEITYYYGPAAEFIVKPEIVADIAASGMTMVPVTYDTETNKKALRLLQLYGLKAIVSDKRIRTIYKEDDLAGADEAARAVVEEYAEFDHIIGWDICDEPNASKFPVLAAIVNAFRFYSPDKETYINLFPNYARPEQLGNPDYMSHLEAFANIVGPDVLSYDHYHFRGRDVDEKCIAENMNERGRLIMLNAIEPRQAGRGFFENLEDIRYIAQKYDMDPMLVVLLVEHGPYRNLTRAEIFWEVNMCLAYGMRRISYFTYWTPKYDSYWRNKNGMVDHDHCEKLPHYYDVQAINREILDIGHCLFDKNSTEIFHVGAPEAGAKGFVPYGGITAIEGKDGVIGFFDDGSVYLVNRNFQYENTFTIHSERLMTIRKDGRFVEFETGTPITLGAGEAVLLKVLQ